MKTRHVTMKDVARRAGVNQSTVSRVLGSSKGPSISAEVRRRVLRIARALDYNRNPSAVALRTGATRAVMVVVSDTTDMYYSAIISGIQEVLAAEDYSLVLHSLAHAGPPSNLPRFIRRFHFDGVLMLGALPGITDDTVRSLRGEGVPIILVGRALKGGDVPSVMAANATGGRLAASHLWALGHQRVAAMRGPRGWPDVTLRIDGFRDELARRGASMELLRLFPCASRQTHSGFEATRKLLTDARPTAIFCMNDTTALGAMRAIREAGLEVPRDVSVVGFDDGELAEFSHPRLTTIHQPRLQMGREGACRLIALLKNEAAVESVVLDVHLVTRESTCPPR